MFVGSELTLGSMVTTLHSQILFSEEMLFSQGVSAGEFAFTAQDARRANGDLHETSAPDQALQTLENLDLALKTAGLDLGQVVSLMVYLPEYSDAAQVAQVLGEVFGKSVESYPATTLIGVAGLEGGCRVRMDAIATSSRDREVFRLTDLSLAPGNRCHGVSVGNFFFLSGVDAAGDEGNVVSPADPISDNRGAREDQQNFECSRAFTQQSLPHLHVHAQHRLSARIRRSAQKGLQRHFRRR
jgi:enamine deaminase RidA (YjgF/YER057c/UK114 family)